MKKIKTFLEHLAWDIILILFLIAMLPFLLSILFFDWLYEGETIDQEPWGRW